MFFNSDINNRVSIVAFISLIYEHNSHRHAHCRLKLREVCNWCLQDIQPAHV
jgi:hypothetical protein